MNLTLAGHHLQITPAIRNYVTTKLERVERHFDDLMHINVVLSVEKLRQKVEANVHIRGKELFIEADDENLYAAIDLLADKLDRQIIRHKEKAVNPRHDSGLKRQPNDVTETTVVDPESRVFSQSQITAQRRASLSRTL